jgi:hypothetical protein
LCFDLRPSWHAPLRRRIILDLNGALGRNRP